MKVIWDDRTYALILQESLRYRLHAAGLIEHVLHMIADDPDSGWQKLVDHQGRMPRPPFPAIQQIVDGVPNGLYSSNQFALADGKQVVFADETHTGKIGWNDNTVLTLLLLRSPLPEPHALETMESIITKIVGDVLDRRDREAYRAARMPSGFPGLRAGI